MVNRGPDHIYFFGGFELDLAHRRLKRNGQIVTLQSKAFDLLVFLVENAGRVVTREEILEAIWPEQFVEESNLTVQISALRKILEEEKNKPHFLVTIPGKGYKFIAEVRSNEENIPESLKSEELVENQTIEDNREDSGQNTQVFHRPLTSSKREFIVNEKKPLKRGFLVGGAVLILVLIGMVGYRNFIQNPSEASPIESIAVMPFVNEGGGDEVEYLSEGITESLINILSQLPGISVKARSTVFHYKPREINPPQVGTDLKVQAIIQGRVVQRGEDLILFLSLVDARTGNQIWGEQYNRKLTDLEVLQNEVARDVVRKLKTKLSGEDEQKLTKKYTTHPEAYRLYLQGRFFWNKRTPNDLKKAIGYFQQAIALDPNYALAYAGLADAYALLPNYGGALQSEAKPKARDAALKALALDDQLAEAWAALGNILIDYDHDFAGAEREYQRALDLNPNYATAHHWYAELLARLGKTEQANAEFRRALDIDPLSLIINRSYGESLLFARKYEEGLAQLNKTRELDPNFLPVYDSLAFAYHLTGNYAATVEGFAKFEDLVGENQYAELMRESFARGGWPKFLQEMTGKRRPANLPLYYAAIFYLELGEKDKAFAELNNSFEKREGFLLMVKVDPRLDSIRDDARFTDLMRRVGF